ncbi:cytochrome P450-dit2 [Apophysomyces ossiformis]|uniref:Cytochrome P450-dit2 n=1 Tax=Apophysomyces ossiformis TaxID=679940 RepID=A0A8H7EN25_9FUNG|nr:cytochrome P450-dit2 [Apophysomyces ossiformis]
MPVELFGTLAQTLFKTMDRTGSTVDVPDLMERWTLDAIGKAGFGFDFHALEEPNNKWVMMYNSIMAGHEDRFYDYLPFLEQRFLWLFPGRRKLHQKLTEFLAMLDDIIVHKREALEKRIPNPHLQENEKDLLTLMIESELNGEGAMSNEELKSNLCVFFVAGHDTTANALSFAIYYLAANQDVQRKAREEVTRILGDEPVDVLPTVEQIKNMDYLNMVIKETLRLNSPAGEIFPRVVTQDTELAGTLLPKDTWVLLDIYNLHRNSRLWQNPDKFDPERFAPGNEAERKAGSGMYWIPFSSGARQCIGMNFSLAEQRVLLSMLLRKFTWTLPENSIHADELLSTNRPLQGPFDLEITFKKRY